ncbi:protein of unknown function [Methylocella tundrae]|uniref:Uncharacterized protein n=1 Tax=Methylocella tundrae TaxID=227605 RepID=A0A4U8Z4W7_METTU|nr:protein of unknown function [Methylocella tundrae]
MASPKLFLSHAGVDTDAARLLMERIEASPTAIEAGLTVWFDKRNLGPGHGWQAQLEAVIDQQSTAFAVYVGSKGVVNWVESEVRLALSRSVADPSFPFIPILSKECKGSSALPPFARQYHGARDPLNDPDEFEKLLKATLRLDQRSPIVTTDTPFIGLRSMDEDWANRFFGRNDDVKLLAEKLGAHRLVAIVADSGSGKSSLAQAGFTPAFRGAALAETSGREPDDRIWHVVVMRPGSDPMQGLKYGLTDAAERIELDGDARANLRQRVNVADPGETAYALRCDLPQKKTATLLIIDQFEELLTQTPQEKRQEFVNLVTALADGDFGFRILLTIRADHYNLCSPFDKLFGMLQGDNQSAVLRLKRISNDGLAEAVRTPLRMAGHTDEAGAQSFVSLIERDMSERPGDLALVQMALHSVWGRRKAHGGDLLKAYAEVHGVAGALAYEAEAVRKNLRSEDQDRLFPVLTRLLRLGETTGGATRRTAQLDGFDAASQKLIALLSSENGSRLLLTSDKTVEIAHEALITQWPWLQNKLNEAASASDMRLLDRLMSKAAGWTSAHRRSRSEHLATGVERAEFLQLARQRGAWLSQTEKKFVTASEKRHRRNLWLLRVLLAVLLVALGVSLYEGFSASQSARQTQHALDVANQALAEGMLNDLDLKADEPFTTRQRNAIWKLAVADEAVKQYFIAALSANPEDMIRVAPEFAQLARALGVLRPASTEAWQLVAAAVAALKTSADGNSIHAVGIAIQALAPKLTESQAQQVFDKVLKQIIGKSDTVFVLQALTQALQGLAPKLTDAQSQQALAAVLKEFGDTDDEETQEHLAHAIQALAPKLNELEVQRALDPMLEQIRAATDLFRKLRLARALKALAPKLTNAQAQQALGPALKQIGETDEPYGLLALAEMIQALPLNLSDAQAQQAFDKIFMLGGKRSSSAEVFSYAVQALASKLNEKQSQRAFRFVIVQFGVNGFPLEVTAAAIQSLAPRLTDEQVQQALDQLTTEIDKDVKPREFMALAQAIQAFPGKLTNSLARRTLNAMLKQFDAAPSDYYLLIEGIRALGPKVTEVQAQEAFAPALQKTGETNTSYGLLALMEAIKALPLTLSEAQAQQALDDALGLLLGRIDGPYYRSERKNAVEAIEALATKLTDSQAQRAIDRSLDPLLEKISENADSDDDQVQALAQAIEALAAKLTEKQAQRIFDVILKRIGRTDDSATLQAIADAIRALAAKLTDVPAQQAFLMTRSSLAWAATSDEAVAWARAIAVSLRVIDNDRMRTVAATIVYPFAAGPATDILLDAIRVRCPEAPPKETGTEAGLEWLTEKNPEALRPPTCPEPLQRESRLKCPTTVVDAEPVSLKKPTTLDAVLSSATIMEGIRRAFQLAQDSVSSLERRMFK